MEQNTDDRLRELETRSSFQEAAIQDLSAMVVDQASRIERLESTLRALRDKVKELAGEGQGPLPPGERPPHY